MPISECEQIPLLELVDRLLICAGVACDQKRWKSTPDQVLVKLRDNEDYGETLFIQLGVLLNGGERPAGESNRLHLAILQSLRQTAPTP